METTLATSRHVGIDVPVFDRKPEALNVADPVTAFKLFYVGALIANPPIVGGRSLTPDINGNIAYTFTQPSQPCDGPTCRQEIFRIDKNPESCWVYDNISIENVEEVPKFFYAPGLASDTVQINSLGNVNGIVFIFRARVSSRCSATS
ncbi:MAG: hypothetical protein ABJA75_17675 [Bradyrhizobium sp.]